jgi:hypothetical protein
MALATLFIGATVLAAAAPVVSSPTDVFAPARNGQLACIVPDKVKKTCRSLSHYTFKDGKIIDTTETLLVEKPLLTVETRSVGEIRGQNSCGTLRTADIEAATFLLRGNPASRRTADRGREAFMSVMANYLDREICTTYVRDGAAFRTVILVNGSEHRHLSQPMIWVGPSDGYEVKP